MFLAQIDILVMGRDFDTLAWDQVRAYVDQKKVVLEDLFVKPDVRRRGIGSELLRQVESLTCFDEGFREVNKEIKHLQQKKTQGAPIPSVDIRLPIPHLTVKEFYAKNGYTWNNVKIVPGREYSVFTASKKLSCAEVPKNGWSVIAGIRASLVQHFRHALHREPVEGPCAVHVRIFNSDFMDAWISIDRP